MHIPRVIFRTIMLSTFLLLLIMPCQAMSATGEKEAGLLLKAMESYKAGDFHKALQEFQEVKELLPDDPDIYYYIGMAYLNLTETERAADYFRMALEKDPGHMDARFQLGSALVLLGEYNDALPHLEQVYASDPGRNNLGYMLGLCLYQTGKYQEAIDRLEQGKSTDPTIKSLTLYYIGLCQMKLGVITEAMDTYNGLLSIDPTSPLAPTSQRLVDILAKAEKAVRRFHTQLTAKLQYDSNVLLVPTTNVFGLREKDRDSVVELVYAKGEYDIVKNTKYGITGSAALLQTINNDVMGIDFTDFILSTGGSYNFKMFGRPANFRMSYSYDYALLDSTSYLTRHTVRPSLSLPRGKEHLTLLQYTLQAKDFIDTPALSSANRDGFNSEIGVTHYLRFNNDRHYLYGGMFGSTENAAGSDWDYYEFKLNAGAQVTLPKEFKLNLDFSFRNDAYRHTSDKYALVNNVNVLLGREKRKDLVQSVSAALSREVLKDTFISAEFLYINNDSNFPLFDYNKYTISVGLTWRT